MPNFPWSSECAFLAITWMWNMKLLTISTSASLMQMCTRACTSETVTSPSFRWHWRKGCCLDTMLLPVLRRVTVRKMAHCGGIICKLVNGVKAEFGHKSWVLNKGLRRESCGSPVLRIVTENVLWSRHLDLKQWQFPPPIILLDPFSSSSRLFVAQLVCWVYSIPNF